MKNENDVTRATYQIVCNYESSCQQGTFRGYATMILARRHKGYVGSCIC
jgi:hypothetical protein